MPKVIAREVLPVDTEDDVVLVRRRVRRLAEEQKFDSFATAALTTATSELTRNIWVHAGRGRVTIDQISDDLRRGLRVSFQDEGPGIPDVPRVLTGGFSTAGSLGLGVAGSRRLVDEFAIDSVVGRGTAVTITKWARF